MKILSTLLITLFLISGVNAQKRTVDVSSFSELSFAVPGTLYIKQGNETKVVVDCSDEIFDRLEFESRGPRLVIRKEGRWNWRDGFRKSELDVYVTVKNLDALSLSGSGTIEGDNQIKTNDFELSVSGSGDINLDLEADYIDISVSGSGDIELTGNAEKIGARISGSGKVDASDMEAKIFKASISGSGNCYANASEEISARVSGSGNIYYSGNPERVDSNSSGSGRIRKQ